jgi:predicted DNA-binding protein YlxM (UPF0122 family)
MADDIVHKALIGVIIDEILDDEEELAHYDDSEDTLPLMYALFKFRRGHVPKVIGFAENVVPQYWNIDFKRDFRINKTTFATLLAEIRPKITYEDRAYGKAGMLPEKQLFIFLWYLVNQNSMRECGRLFNVSKATVHKCVRRVSIAISGLTKTFIKWPSIEEQAEISANIEEQSHIPNCVGFIDGTHIRLSAVPDGEQDYINRKGYPSVQLQLICDDKMMIRDAYVGWPGCAHDARVFRNSPISEALHNDDDTLLSQDAFIIGT